MPNKTTYEDIQITDKLNLDSSIIAASAGAVKDVYDKAQNSISEVYISGTDITYKKNNGTTQIIVSEMSDAEAKTGTATTQRTITAKVLDDKITSRLEVTPVKQSSYLTADTKKNGWYSVESETIAGIEDESWLISKFGNSRVGYIYTAICTKDPRIVLNSNDTKNWYSPYAYWHA